MIYYYMKYNISKKSYIMFEQTIYLYAVICSGGMQPDMLRLQKYGEAGTLLKHYVWRVIHQYFQGGICVNDAIHQKCLKSVALEVLTRLKS